MIKYSIFHAFGPFFFILNKIDKNKQIGMKNLLLLIVLPLVLTLSTTPTTNATTASPATVKLCGFNAVGPVSDNNKHSYSLLQNKTTNFQPADFSVAFQEDKVKNHPFFSWLGQQADFKGSFSKMLCHITDKANFGRTCNISLDNIDSDFQTAFGKDIIFRCQVPQNHMVLDLRFVQKLGNLTCYPGGKWSAFAGLHQFKDQNDAKNIILTKGLQISSQLNTTKLDTFAVDNDLNILPTFVQWHLVNSFNSNVDSSYVKGVQVKTEQKLTDFAYLRVLPPGKHFIIGSIFNGTTNVKQMCDKQQYIEGQNCGLNIVPK